VASAWTTAGFRIVMAKNATDAASGYALCLATLLDAIDVPPRADPGDAAIEVLRQSPPRFAIVDALISRHGSLGRTPISTGVVIASPDALLADHTGALLMGIDPAVSPLTAKALSDVGLPASYAVRGDITRYAGWRNPPPALRAAARRAPPGLLRLLRSSPDREQDPVGARLADLLAPMAGAADDSPTALAALLWVHYAAAAHDSATAWSSMFAKHRVPRRRVPLALDLGDYTAADYEAMAGYLEPLERLASATPPTTGGLRWCYHDGAVLFEFGRDVAGSVRRVRPPRRHQ
jgi:hypothetical protein